LNIALWSVQILLGLVFLYAGIMKLFLYEKAKSSMLWMEQSSRSFVLFVGIVDLLGGLGLVLPGAFGIAPILTVVSAIGVALIMVFAIVLHASRKEYQVIAPNVVFLLMALFVAYGRYLSNPF
jgi:putative oxidoreductase